MPQELIAPSPTAPNLPAAVVPELFAQAGPDAGQRFIEFFTAEHRNPNTRAAYFRAVRQFAGWAAAKRFRLADLSPVHVAAYIEELGRELAAPTVKQHLAAIRMLFDYLVRGGVCRHNPAMSVRGPKHVVEEGKTPVLSADEARGLFGMLGKIIENANADLAKQPDDRPAQDHRLAALRDRALIGVMVFSFARIGATLAMNVEDYHQQGKRWYLALSEKGGKARQIPVHHQAEEYLDAYIETAGIAGQKGTPLFRTIDSRRQLTVSRMPRQNALAMIKRRARQAELGDGLSCHSFRATGITAFLLNGGRLETAQLIAGHASPRTTRLYDRSRDQVTLGEIEKIRI